MEEIREKKQEVRDEVARKIAALSPEQIAEKTKAIENRLFEFANFLESRIVLFYTPAPNEVDTLEIIRRSSLYSKIIVLPAVGPNFRNPRLLKVDDVDKDLVPGPRGIWNPTPSGAKACPSIAWISLSFQVWPWMKKAAGSEPGGEVMTA
jgi:5-formyltetrahydrofolate cyclo-ligase